MNHRCEMWSLPWHALQKNLAAGLGENLLESPAPALKAANVWGIAKTRSRVKARGMAKVPGFTVSANTWLSRVQRRWPAEAQARL
jgi:hypothetical protein